MIYSYIFDINDSEFKEPFMKSILLSILLLFVATSSFAKHDDNIPVGCISEYEAEITLAYELTWGDLVPQRPLPAGYLMTLSTSIKWQEFGDAYYSGKAFYTQAFDPYGECDDDRSCYDIYKIDCDGVVTKYIDKSEN